MDLAIAVVTAYGLFTLGGGIIGYLKAKSVPSIVIGSLMGLLLLYSAFRMRQYNPIASYVAIAISILLTVRFFFTWKKNHRMAPDFLMVLLGLITIMVVSAVVMAGI